MTTQTRAWFARMDRTVLKYLAVFLKADDIAQLRASSAKSGVSVIGTVAGFVSAGLSEQRHVDRLVSRN